MNLEKSLWSEPVSPVLASPDADSQQATGTLLGVPVMREIPPYDKKVVEIFGLAVALIGSVLNFREDWMSALSPKGDSLRAVNL